MLSLWLCLVLLGFAPGLAAQQQPLKDRATGLTFTVKNQDSAKKKATQPASKKPAPPSGGFAAKPARKDIKRSGGGPSLLNKKKTLAAAAGSAAAAAAQASKSAGAATEVPEGRPSNGQKLGLHGTDDPLDLRSSVAYVMDADSGHVVFEKNAGIIDVGDLFCA
ncbi:MAG: hypothetical protein EBV92_03520, partial [Betaproteobacteria bacterium]|nr:hypothetical protein [Betaproteobacteria bacterium]